MPCTLKPVILEANNVPTVLKDMDPSSDHYAVWSLDKNAWRSFRLSTVEGWEVHGE